MADQRFRNIINGESVDAADGSTYDLVNPATGEVYASAPASKAEDVDRAFRAADTAFETWGDTTPAERQKALLRIADALEARAEEFVRVESENTGKPMQMTTDEEIPPCVDQLRFFAGAARVLEGRASGEYLKDHTSSVRREPIGVVAQVTPWNYPLMMMVWKIAPALAAGNTDRAQAVGHHAGVDDAVRRDGAGVPAARRLQRGVRRPRHRSCAGRAPRPADGLDHRLGAGGHGGRRLRGAPSSSGPTSSSAARRRWWSSTTPTSRRPREGIAAAGYFNAGQDCTAATRVLAGPGRARRLRRGADRAGPQHQDRGPPTRTCSTARSTTRTSSTGSRA